jgi:hypothetical protein
MQTWRTLFWQRMRWNRGSIINFWIHRDMFFNRRYGLFGMFVLPTSIVMIGITVISFFHTFYKMSYNIIRNFDFAAAAVQGGFKSASILFYPESFTIPPVLTTAIIILLLFFFLLLNALGLFMTRERLRLQYLFAVLATPLIYGPVLVFFWVSALGLQAGKTGVRWR